MTDRCVETTPTSARATCNWYDNTLQHDFFFFVNQKTTGSLKPTEQSTKLRAVIGAQVTGFRRGRNAFHSEMPDAI